MAEEIVYADLNLQGESPCTGRPQPAHPAKSSHFPPWHRVALRISCAGNMVLLGALMALSIWASPLPEGCKLCPPNWQLHGDKCYWLSKESKTWNQSREDCSEKSSRLLILRGQEEKEFIRNVTEGIYSFWIGLRLTDSMRNWTWVDGSLFNQTRVLLAAPGAGSSCGVWKENKIRGEMCSTDVKWICQRDAVPL
ncbi:killer cell lectin-like receptor subfamily B member 1A [Pelodiscus sinensis]|uniref:killer cell lectin-like receptor subfamily B member 1A n=1 Tax=Pelodiscus sinensis TaxID=13735 RepID=UPI003F6D5E33